MDSIFIEALKGGITPAIVVAVYLVIIKIIDNKKEKLQIKINNDLVVAINKISLFLDQITNDIIEKDKLKCQNAIEDAFYSSAMKLATFIATTLVNNHIINNRETIIANIKNIINNEYYSVYASLNLYTINNIKVSDWLNKEWMAEIEKDMIDIIYNTELKNEDKMISFANKINFRFQTYITYITNKTIK